MWGGGSERWRDQRAVAEKLLQDPDLAFVPADAKATWTASPRSRAGYANIAEFLKKYSDAGGKILAATDTGITGIIPGVSLHYEMQMLADMGIPPMKALQAATLWAAEVLGREKDLGSIQVGKLADFTIIEGNPLADIGATKNVRMVIKGGEVMKTSYDPKWVNPVRR
jgi:imidazolonepropionase-like amidohydrolase